MASRSASARPAARSVAVCRMLRSAPGHRLADVSAHAGITASGAVKALAGLHARGRCAAAAQTAVLSDSRAAMLLALEHPACPPSAVRALAAARVSRVAHVTGCARGAAAWTARDTTQEGPVPSWRLRVNVSLGDLRGLWFVAQNVGCSPVLLDRLGADRDTRVSYAARSNPSYRGSRPVVRSELSEAANTRLPGGSNAGGGPRDRRHRTQHDLEALAGSYSTMDRAAAAADRHASGDLLERLCADADRYVRLQVARNPGCPPEVLGRMAADSDVGVRAAVAGHKASSAELLVSLASDHRGEVSAALAANPSTPPRVLAGLVAVNGRRCRRLVAANPSASRRLLADLAQDSDFVVRKKVAANVSCPRSVLRWLRHDPSQQVTEEAVRQYRSLAENNV